MSTPPYNVPFGDVNGIISKLECEQARQRAVDRETTPEAIFQTDAKHSYKLECELLHAKYEDDEIDRIRLGIADSKYWQKDADSAAHCLLTALLAKSRKRHTTDGVTDFRSMSTELRRLSEEQGQSSQQFRRQRDTITDEQYWEKEAEHFKRESARREFETREKWRSDLGAILSPAQSESDDGGKTATQEFLHSRETMPSVMPKEC
ncbi:uncharacterized protein G6M90_00g095050 [Metarhizium brunneum]|uniref:Uncharacterized protein n=1 Tax=Metarhizium brunneum TaxID=500148 RepID=A0A7D5YYI2_9HYPO